MNLRETYKKKLAVFQRNENQSKLKGYTFLIRKKNIEVFKNILNVRSAKINRF